MFSRDFLLVHGISLCLVGISLDHFFGRDFPGGSWDFPFGVSHRAQTASEPWRRWASVHSTRRRLGRFLSSSFFPFRFWVGAPEFWHRRFCRGPCFVCLVFFGSVFGEPGSPELWRRDFLRRKERKPKERTLSQKAGGQAAKNSRTAAPSKLFPGLTLKRLRQGYVGWPKLGLWAGVSFAYRKPMTGSVEPHSRPGRPK